MRLLDEMIRRTLLEHAVRCLYTANWAILLQQIVRRYREDSGDG